jgi:hypothetical protein
VVERDLAEHVRGMSDDEIEATRRDLATGLGFMLPSNGMYAPATAFLNAVNGEIARRAISEASLLGEVCETIAAGQG